MRTTVTASIPVMLWTVKTGISRNSRLPDSVANMLTVPRDGCPRHIARELTHPPFCQSLPGRFQQRHRLAQLLLYSVPAAADDGVKPVWEAFVDQRSNPKESCRPREWTELLTEAINRLGPKIRRTILLSVIEE